MLQGNAKSNARQYSTTLDKRSEGELMVQNDLEHSGL